MVRVGLGRVGVCFIKKVVVLLIGICGLVDVVVMCVRCWEVL